MDEVKELLEALKKLYESDEVVSKDPDTEEEYFDSNLESNHLTRETEACACGALIEDGGQCNWYNIRLLREAGYDVFPGEKDSFGWLTGCIQKNGDNRILVYG